MILEDKILTFLEGKSKIVDGPPPPPDPAAAPAAEPPPVPAH
jgi:hypothetical protein